MARGCCLVQMERDLTYEPYSEGTWRAKAWSEGEEGRVTLAKMAGRHSARAEEDVRERARTAWRGRRCTTARCSSVGRRFQAMIAGWEM